MAILVIVLVVIALALWHRLAAKHLKFFETAGVKCITPPTIQGAIKGTFLGEPKELYSFEPNEPYVGIVRLHSQAVSIRDPDLIKLVLSKDFAHFHHRALLFNEKRDVLSSHLFNIEGRRWKVLRAKLTPAFTSGKLRSMFPLVKYCVDQMTDIVSSTHADKPETVDLNDILARCTTDIILSCAFGLQGNSLKDPEDIYLKMVKKSLKNSWLRDLDRIFFRMFPSLEEYVPPLPYLKEVNQFFLNAFAATLQEREKSGKTRNDFLELMLEIQRNGMVKDGSSNNEDFDSSFEFSYKVMASQAFEFFIAGSETSSNAASFAVIELANNVEIQDRLRAEIDEKIERHGGITYEAIMNMTYLDMVVCETLRRYPPVKLLLRKVTQPYRMPDGRVTLPAGTRVFIPVMALQNDPKHYPEPQKFDPERFTPEAKLVRHKYVYLPFGEGPRTCIGLRFGMLQVKLALASLISQFELRPKPGIAYPPVLSRKSVLTSLEHGAPVAITRRKQKE